MEWSSTNFQPSSRKFQAMLLRTHQFYRKQSLGATKKSPSEYQMYTSPGIQTTHALSLLSSIIFGFGQSLAEIRPKSFLLQSLVHRVGCRDFWVTLFKTSKYFYSFYRFESKVCRMVKLCNPNNWLRSYLILIISFNLFNFPPFCYYSETSIKRTPSGPSQVYG